MFCLNSNLFRKPLSLQPTRCVVNRIVHVSDSEFFDILARPLEDRELFEMHSDAMGPGFDDYAGCILITCNGSDDAVLVDAEGYSDARYAAVVPQGKLLAQNQDFVDLPEQDIEPTIEPSF